MPSFRHFLILLITTFGFCGILDYAQPKLSDYGFFEEPLKNQVPKSHVIPYQISTPLFTDYAKKLRFIVLPQGEKMTYVDSDKIDFPIGTTLIKTFYYPQDFRNPHENWNILETRLLIHTKDGWLGFPYIWNEKQTNAYLEIAGDRMDISWIDEVGKKMEVNYLVPNFNMCKGCHVIDNFFSPIGPKPRLLNCDFKSMDGDKYHQLENFKKLNIVQNLPEINEIQRTADWENESYPLDERARAYLDVNCGHCHNAKGPAMTSGLFLDYNEKDLRKLGVHKTPIAAGRGSGNLDYNIIPKKPDESILLYRMNSDDPGIMMPETGRKLIHKEGVELIREWIQKMEAN